MTVLGVLAGVLIVLGAGTLVICFFVILIKNALDAFENREWLFGIFLSAVFVLFTGLGVAVLYALITHNVSTGR